MIKLENITLKEASEIAGGDEKLLQGLFDKFRQWLEQQIHLPQEIPDNRLRSMLLASKFDLEKAKKRLDSLYTLRTLLPELFANYDPIGDDITRYHKCAQFVVLPKLTPEKYRVSVARFTNYDSSMFHVLDTIKYLFMLMDVRTEEDTVNSDLLIWDCSITTFNHLIKYTPSLLKKGDLCLEAYGIRFKAIYIINAPTYIDRLLKLVKMVMKPKLYERIQVFTSGIESLHEVVPKSILPADYGGDEPSMQTLTDMWRAKLMERRDWLLGQEKLKTEESLRTEGVINADDLFGVAGTFRKLDID